MVMLAEVTMAIGGGSVILSTVGVTIIKKNVGGLVILATVTMAIGGGSVILSTAVSYTLLTLPTILRVLLPAVTVALGG